MKRNIVIGAVAAAVIVAAALIVIFVPFGGGPSDQEARQRADMLFAEMRAQGGTATYKAVEPDGNGLVIKGLTMTPPTKATSGKKRTITVDELRIRDMDWKNSKQPTFADIEFSGARIAGIKSDPQFQQFAAMTGLDDLVLSGHIKYRVDKDKNELVVEPFHLAIDKMGAYTLTLSLDGLNVKQIEDASKGGKMNPGALMGLAGAVRLRSLSLKIKDDGGFERMLKAAAAKQNKSPDDLKKQALAQIDGLAASPMGKSKLVSEALAAAKKFITNPGTITLEAKPPAPVAVFPVVMGAMSGGPKPENLDQIKSQLGVTITAE
jgi:hypothetical protein